MSDKALKKIFAKLDELSTRVDHLGTDEKLEEIRQEIAKVSSNSRIVVSVVKSHGTAIARLERLVNLLHEHVGVVDDESVVSEKEDLPTNKEFGALAVAASDGQDGIE